MLDIKKLIKKALVSTCVIFTVITAVYMLILQLTNVTQEVSAAVEASRILLFFVFSLLLSIANAILSIEKIEVIARYMFHYIICSLGFLLCFCRPNGMGASKLLVGIIFFSIGYAIVMPIIAFFKRRFAKNKTIQEKKATQAQNNNKSGSKKQTNKKKK